MAETKQEITAYICCYTCGTYIPQDKAYKASYCSKGCSYQYKRCV